MRHIARLVSNGPELELVGFLSNTRILRVIVGDLAVIQLLVILILDIEDPHQNRIHIQLSTQETGISIGRFHETELTEDVLFRARVTLNLVILVIRDTEHVLKTTHILAQIQHRFIDDQIITILIPSIHNVTRVLRDPCPQRDLMCTRICLETDHDEILREFLDNSQDVIFQSLFID